MSLLVSSLLASHSIKNMKMSSKITHRTIKSVRSKHRDEDSGDEKLRKLIDMFDRCDSMDRSGTLCDDEIYTCLKPENPSLTAAQVSRLVRQYDTNGDGELQLEEFIPFYDDLMDGED